MKWRVFKIKKVFRDKNEKSLEDYFFLQKTDIERGSAGFIEDTAEHTAAFKMGGNSKLDFDVKFEEVSNKEEILEALKNAVEKAKANLERAEREFAEAFFLHQALNDEKDDYEFQKRFKVF